MRNYYHIYAAGQWQGPVAEHVAALKESGFDGELLVGIVGPSVPVVDFLRSTGIEFTVVARDIEGWEQVTLEALRAELPFHDGPVLYTHTKGASDASEWNHAWRRSMTMSLVGGWRESVAKLGDGYDAVGCHWLDPGKVQPYPMGGTPIFGGNFWWANVGYLRTLPPLSLDSRHEAETWVGQGNPRVFDWTPGWPGWRSINKAALPKRGVR